MGYLRVRNWDKFQHYNDDKPVTWVKLHIKILDDPLVRSLDEASQSHLFKLFALAGRRANVLPDNPVALGALIDAKTPVNIESLAHWLEESDGTPQIKSRRESRLSSNNSVALNTLVPKPSLDRRGAGKQKKEPSVDPLLVQPAQVVADWNEVASKRGWPQCSKVPGGANGESLFARCREKHFADNYKQAIEKLAAMTWPDSMKLSVVTRGDTVRAIIDGEWDDRKNKPTAAVEGVMAGDRDVHF